MLKIGVVLVLLAALPLLQSCDGGDDHLAEEAAENGWEEWLADQSDSADISAENPTGTYGSRIVIYESGDVFAAIDALRHANRLPPRVPVSDRFLPEALSALQELYALFFSYLALAPQPLEPLVTSRRPHLHPGDPKRTRRPVRRPCP